MTVCVSCNSAMKGPKSEANRKRNEKSVLSGACGGGVSRTCQLRKQLYLCVLSLGGGETEFLFFKNSFFLSVPSLVSAPCPIPHPPVLD